jgi:acetyltransferase-like isoleucine patch superfamily enzyme
MIFEIHLTLSFPAAMCALGNLFLLTSSSIVDPARVHHSIPNSPTAASLHTPETDEFSSEDNFSLKRSKSLPLTAVTPIIEPAVPKVKQPVIMEYGLRVRIDPTAFINFNCTILDTPVADIAIGAHVMIGPNVGLYAVSHSMAADPKTGHRTCQGGGIAIEDRVWIGGDSTVL